MGGNCRYRDALAGAAGICRCGAVAAAIASIASFGCVTVRVPLDVLRCVNVCVPLESFSSYIPAT